MKVNAFPKNKKKIENPEKSDFQVLPKNGNTFKNLDGDIAIN